MTRPVAESILPSASKRLPALPTERTVAWATAGIVFAVLLLAGDGYVSLHNASILQHYQGWVEHTFAAQQKVERLDSLITEGLAHERSYVLTRLPTSLERYTAVRTTVPAEIADFAAFTSDNPVQRANSAALRQQTGAEFTLLDAHVAGRRPGLTPAEEQAAALPSRTGMTAVRQTLEAMPGRGEAAAQAPAGPGDGRVRGDPVDVRRRDRRLDRADPARLLRPGPGDPGQAPGGGRAGEVGPEQPAADRVDRRGHLRRRPGRLLHVPQRGRGQDARHRRPGGG